MRQGRVAQVTVTATIAGKPAPNRMLVPYLGGKRWGSPVITDARGQAHLGIPLMTRGEAHIAFDSVGVTNSALPDRWIWADHTDEQQTVRFERSFTLTEAPSKAVLYIAADNAARVRVNFKQVGTFEGWSNVRPIDIQPYLQAGDNQILIDADNAGGPASLTARIEIQTGKTQQTIVTDRSWSYTDDLSIRKPAKELGSLTGYIIAPSPWPGVEAKGKIPDGMALIQSPSVSNTLTIAVTPPEPAGSLPTPKWDVYADTWVATDGLGHSLPTFEDVGPPRPGKTVGLFYYVWHEYHSRLALAGGRKLLDTTDFLRANPTDPQFVSGTYWWSEPLFGYYNDSDAYVLRKHVQMLSDAGIDALLLDSTNDAAYWEQWLELDDMLAHIRQSGQPAPTVAQIFWASTPTLLPDVVHRLYEQKLYPDLWFRWKGKPVVLADAARIPADIADTLAKDFTLRTSWAWTNLGGWFGDGKDKWPWLDNAPQRWGWHESPDKPEQMVVSAGHHASTNRGRSLTGNTEPPKRGQHPELGIQFAEQWRRALEVDPEFLFITQWNEWIAGGYPSEKDGMFFDGRILKKGQKFFIDEYNPEFSRDIEPMKGGFGDNYYYQMVANIRRYKGVRPIPPVVPKPITIDGRFDDWKADAPEFRDTLGDPAHRDAWSWAWLRHYTNTSGRNDIAVSKVSYDTRNVYFYVRTTAPLTPPSGPSWMQLFLDSDRNPKTGWLGYDFVVHRIPSRNGKAFIERNAGGNYRWEKPVAVECRIKGNEMEIAIPRTVLRITRLPATIDFKWADNCILDPSHANWSDFTLNGDAAPNDRFNYRAKLGR